MNDIDFPSGDGGDLLIVGAGMAGLCVALHAPQRKVVLLSPHPLGDGCASAWAQGGIAAAIGKDDDAGAHVNDTIAAGGGLVDAAVARRLSESIPAAVAELAALGVPFDRATDGGLSLGREAAHSKARIVRVGGDGAGRAIMQALAAALRRRENVRVLEGARARALLLADGRVVGVSAETADGMRSIRAESTVLACGGIGQLYRHTTNPSTACGEGIALAARAGALLADMEFVQFHPTAMDLGSDPLPLATEALRGEGAILVDRNGTRFAHRAHERGELAPRDVVARAIARERRRGPVFLDAREAVGEALPRRFPAVYQACREAGLDALREPIPVRAAAHYHMGGIAVDGRGRSSLPGLWACGEVASSGLHGANRLAGNSLGEALVFARAIAEDTAEDSDALPPPTAEQQTQERVLPARGEEKQILRLRDVMSEYVGLERDEDGLRQTLVDISSLRQTAAAGGRLAAMADTALLITAAALQRRESRGCHFRVDFPAAIEPPRRSHITLAQAEGIASQTSPPATFRQTRAAR